MKNILILGSGLSSYVLIEFLHNQCKQNNWQMTVCDINPNEAQKIIGNSEFAQTEVLDINKTEDLKKKISSADIVISLLPASYHLIPARICLELGKNFATASYVSDEMLKMNEQVKEKGLIFINEIGLDPGIDHMSAMIIINDLKNKGAQINDFLSFTGGVIAPNSDNNPWNYKFTWNPRNVVVAGQGTAKFLENGQFKYRPYHNLFKHKYIFNIPNYGEFEGYPNRDSLKYRSIYGLDDVKTMIRGTLRRPGFIDSWNIFVQLGVTDDTYTIENSENMTYRQFINSFLPFHQTKTVEQKLADFMGFDADDYKFYRLRWLGLFEDTKIGLKNATPAQILQKILEQKLVFKPEDTDLIVMQHIFKYTLNNKNYCIKSSFAYEGKDKHHSAMATTVGLPLAIAVKLILQGEINIKGVVVPTIPEVYKPVMNELKDYGINFLEQNNEI